MCNECLTTSYIRHYNLMDKNTIFYIVDRGSIPRSGSSILNNGSSLGSCLVIYPRSLWSIQSIDFIYKRTQQFITHYFKICYIFKNK